MRILIADDDDISRRILQTTLLNWGYEVVIACNGIEALRLLQETNAPQLAILDWMMPGMDGIDVCRELRKREDLPYIYILLLTARSRKKDLVLGLRAGADDYVKKPFDPPELEARLRTGKRILDLQAQLLATRESLRHQATHDSLTGLCNRGAILDILRNELDRANRRGVTPLSLLLADIDHFKEINDTYGHTIGDTVLHEAARRMKSCVRAYDSIGRYGGEEFLFVLPGCDGNDAVNQAQRLQTAITAKPVELPRITVAFTMSFGVVARTNPKVEDLDLLIHAADSAMYQAKGCGRNRIIMAEPNQRGPVVPVPSAALDADSKETESTDNPAVETADERG